MTKEELELLDKVELRAKAKEMGLKPPGFFGPDQIIAMILKAQSAPEPTVVKETQFDEEGEAEVVDLNGNAPAPTENVSVIPDEFEAKSIGDSIPAKRTLLSYLSLRAIAKSLGISPKVIAAEELEQVIVATDPVESHHWLPISNAGELPVVLNSSTGNYSAKVFGDGRAEITKFGSPNLHNRPKGFVSSDDVTMFVEDLGEFESLLNQLHDEASFLVEQALIASVPEEIAESAPLTKEQLEMNPATVIQIECGKYGLGHINSTEQPYKLAEAIGVEYRHPKLDEDGQPVIDVYGKPVFAERLSFDDITNRVMEKLRS